VWAKTEVTENIDAGEFRKGPLLPEGERERRGKEKRKKGGKKNFKKGIAC